MISCKLFYATVLALVPVADSWACTKSVRWFDDPPYTFQGKDGEIAGLDADLAREALQLVGCRAKFVHMPWARALIELERGNLDILPGAFRTPEREQFAHFSVPLPHSANVLYLSQSAAKKYNPRALDELAGTPFRLGAQIGVSYGDKFDQFKANPAARANLVPVTLRCSAWKMIELGRLDGMIADEASASFELRQLGLAHLVMPSKVTVSTETAMFALGKANNAPQFVADFDKALGTLLASGQYRKLRERYWGEGSVRNTCGAQSGR